MSMKDRKDTFRAAGTCVRVYNGRVVESGQIDDTQSKITRKVGAYLHFFLLLGFSDCTFSWN